MVSRPAGVAASAIQREWSYRGRSSPDGRGFDSPQLHFVQKCPLTWFFTPGHEGAGFPHRSEQASDQGEIQPRRTGESGVPLPPALRRGSRKARLRAGNPGRGRQRADADAVTASPAENGRNGSRVSFRCIRAAGTEQRQPARPARWMQAVGPVGGAYGVCPEAERCPGGGRSTGHESGRQFKHTGTRIAGRVL